jgi:hypothetical protein
MKFIYIFLLLFSLSARAETITNVMPCDKNETIARTLTEKFKETPILIGNASDAASSIMTLWTNVDTGTWTIVATKNNISCIVGVGRKLRIIELGTSV